MRIDKYLWAVRVFKTRSQAGEACRKGKVKIQNQEVKPSREVRIDDIINVEKDHLERIYRVLGLLHTRLSARVVQDYIEDLTPVDAIEEHRIMMKARRENTFFGAGRPTKKQRRLLEKLKKTDSRN